MPMNSLKVSITYLLNTCVFSIDNVNAIALWTKADVRKRAKYLVFLRPMQVPTHGQWWSWTSIQMLHWSQWKDRGGLILLQVSQ